MPDDDLESLLRKLETELGQVQEQLAATRARKPGEPPRRSTLRFGAVTDPTQEPEPATVREAPVREAPPREVPRHTGVKLRAPTMPMLPATEVPEEPKSDPGVGRYTLINEPSRKRRKG